MNLLLEFDQKQLAATKARYLIGVDEVGRGALAGPVVAGAVCLRPDFYKGSFPWPFHSPINDSKQLSASQRETIFEAINKLKADKILFAESGSADVEEIERFNVLGATRLAMQRALEKMIQMFDEEIAFFTNLERPAPLASAETVAVSAKPLILIDGRPLKSFPYPHHGVVKGDGKSLAIALASIYAKVTRDNQMKTLDKMYPDYGFARHKGYGTPAHRKAILVSGSLALHRPRFLRKVFSEDQQTVLKSLL